MTNRMCSSERFSQSRRRHGWGTAGSASLIGLVVQRASSLPVQYAGQPPAAVGAILAAIELMDTDASFTERLWENYALWKEAAEAGI